MNYYYEFPKEVTVLGRPNGGYYVLSQNNQNIDEAARQHAIRIWEEDNGQVKLVKNYNPRSYDPPGSLEYNEQEFMLVKLRAKDII